MTSPDLATKTGSEPTKSSTTEDTQRTGNAAAAGTTQTQDLTQTDELELDDGDGDSAFGTDQTDTTSISASIYEGYVENGRRYQNLRQGEYWGPSDAKQFEAQQAAHIVYRILDSQQKNPLFRSPIPETAQNILDIGTGSGAWAVEVADRLPCAFVQGIDLYPPPDTWVPPNCKFEVDDVLKKWMFKENGRFDLIHMRDLYGSFTDKQWTGVYKQAYENLAPGGWIEELESNVYALCDDGTLPPDSILATSGPAFLAAGRKMGNPVDTIDKMKDRIAAAGFINIQEKLYKVPLGDWVKNPILKEAGRFCKAHILTGMEGFAMLAFTHFGEPTPWTADEVKVWLAKFRKDVETKGIHAYYLKRRVWAQKPFDAPKEENKVEVETAA